MATPLASHIPTGVGILGNVVSLSVYLAPLPTFGRIYKKKSTEGFQATPYSVALFSAMLYLYYAYLKGNALLLVTINSFGCVTEILYLIIFMIYATKESKVFTTKLILLFNVSSLVCVIAGTYFLARDQRVQAVGWICAAFSVSVFAAPLSIMRQVIRTKSVEFMPPLLSFFLTICSIVWFAYGFLIKDFFVAGPNIIGFLFGIIQIALYFVYKNSQQQTLSNAESKVHNIEMEPRKNDQVEEDLENQPDHKSELDIVVIENEEVVLKGTIIIESNMA